MNPRGRSGCRRAGCLGCLTLSGMAVCLVAVFIVAGPSLLPSLGLGGITAEELYSGAPDPVAGAWVDDILVEAGVNGARVAVFNVPGGEGNVALITLDQDAIIQGVASEAEAEAAFMQIVGDLASADREGLNLSHVVIDYRDAEGNSLLGVGANQDDINAFASGEISRAEFLRHVEIDYTRLISADQLQQLLEEAR